MTPHATPGRSCSWWSCCIALSAHDRGGRWFESTAAHHDPTRLYNARELHEFAKTRLSAPRGIWSGLFRIRSGYSAT